MTSRPRGASLVSSDATPSSRRVDSEVSHIRQLNEDPTGEPARKQRWFHSYNTYHNTKLLHSGVQGGSFAVIRAFFHPDSGALPSQNAEYSHLSAHAPPQNTKHGHGVGVRKQCAQPDLTFAKLTPKLT